MTTTYPAMRLGTHLATLGLCSRRGAVDLVATGTVRVNGQVPNGPGHRITDQDEILINGKVMPGLNEMAHKDPRVFVAYKRRGELMTMAKGAQESFFDRPMFQPGFSKTLPPFLRSVGRLDVASEGLVVLTDSGRLQRFLELPANGFEREYIATCASRHEPDENGLRWIRKGAVLDGEQFRAMNVKLTRSVRLDTHSYETYLSIIVKEGKFHEIRRVFGSIGMSVVKLKRVRFGPFELTNGVVPDDGRIAEVLSPLTLLPKALRTRFIMQGRNAGGARDDDDV